MCIHLETFCYRVKRGKRGLQNLYDVIFVLLTFLYMSMFVEATETPGSVQCKPTWDPGGGGVEGEEGGLPAHRSNC